MSPRLSAASSSPASASTSADPALAEHLDGGSLVRLQSTTANFEARVANLLELLASRATISAPAPDLNEPDPDDLPADLCAWIVAVRELWSLDLLSAEKVAMLSEIPGWQWPQSDDWGIALASLAAYVDSEGPIDFACDAQMQRPELAWARDQQLVWPSLSCARRNLLAELPGWSERTNSDRLREGALPGLRFLAFRGHSDENTLAKLLHLLPSTSVARMAQAQDTSSVRYNEVLAAAAEPANDVAGQQLDLLLNLLPPAARTDDAVAFLATHLTEVSDEHVGARVLAFLMEKSNVAVVATGAVGGGIGVGVVEVTPSVEEALGSSRALLLGPASAGDLGGGQQALAHRHIACLGLSVRTHNALIRAGLTRVGDLLRVEDPADLLALRGFGQTCLDDARERLRAVKLDPLF